MSRVKQIVTGYWNVIFQEVEAKELSKERLSICNTCKHNSKSKYKYSFRKPYCTLCKCNLSAKTSCTFCSCPIGKWKAKTTKQDFWL